MRRLFLVRHAKAEPAVGRDDYERKLTDRGREDARRMAAALKARNMAPEVLIHSGAARAMETAEIFAAMWENKIPLEKDLRIYDASPSTLFAIVRGLPDSRKRAALVGHNPGLAEFALSLVGSGAQEEIRRMALKFPTCAVAALDFRVQAWDDAERGSALLSLFLTPGEVEA